MGRDSPVRSACDVRVLGLVTREYDLSDPTSDHAAPETQAGLVFLNPNAYGLPNGHPPAWPSHSPTRDASVRAARSIGGGVSAVGAAAV